MPRMPTESTFLRTIDERTHEIFCTRCGGFLRVALPMRIEDYTRQLTAFNRSHRNCPEPATTARPDPTTDARCVRCGAILNNLAPGFSYTPVGFVCMPCLKPGEELARARSL